MAQDSQNPQTWTDSDYIEQRLDNQIDWYDRKSGLYKTSFHRLRVIEILVAASIPFLVPYANTIEIKIAVGVMGIIVAVIGSLLVLYKYQDNWVGYRKTAELLKSHKIRYMTGAAPYNTTTGDARFKLLVANAEEVMSAEWSSWAEVTLKSDKDKEQEAGASSSDAD